VERVKEADQTGAVAIATACPWCVGQFNEAIAKHGSPLKVLTLSN
jgi:Fe-S oxidoreductase